MSWILNNGNYPTQDTWESEISVLSEPYPVGVFSTTNDYPLFSSWRPKINVLSEPLPSGLFLTIEGYPEYAGWESKINVPSEPYPVGLFLTDKDYPKYTDWDQIDMGAFVNSEELQIIEIPLTVKFIGEHAFENTKIKSVTISKDCIYSDTSFPENCNINLV